MYRAITNEDLQEYVKENIGSFHQTRLKKLSELKLDKILQKKNPYLFRAKNLVIASDLIKSLLDAYISSQEETIFGNFLEGIAIFVNKKVYGGWKSTATGIDLEFTKDDVRYMVSIKSGPNWGNSSQIVKLKDDFAKATRILRQSNKRMNVRAINGCCYGRVENTDRGEYDKYCGQKFWEFISGDENLYKEIIKPLGYRAKQKNSEYMKRYAKIVNQFTVSFMERFCKNGEIQWQDLVEFNSSGERAKSKRKKKP